MRKILKFFIVMSPIMGFAANVNVCVRQGPLTNCSEGVLPSLHVAGKARLDGTTVTGKTKIAGMIDANHVHFNSLHVAGMATLQKTDINGESHISGMLNACQSTFNKTLNIASDRIHLSKSNLMNIEIDPGGRHQVLCLSDKTSVNGNVNFKSGKGIVAMDASSIITGTVTGGVINLKLYKTYCGGDELC